MNNSNVEKFPFAERIAQVINGRNMLPPDLRIQLIKGDASLPSAKFFNLAAEAASRQE